MNPLAVCHAEMNAIVSKYTPTDLTGCRIYQTQHPCIDCAKLIVQSGIKTIYYLYEKGKEEEQTAKILLDEARVTCRCVSAGTLN